MKTDLGMLSYIYSFLPLSTRKVMFSVCLSVLTEAGGGTPSQDRGTSPPSRTRERVMVRRGRYASCGHAIWLSCLSASFTCRSPKGKYSRRPAAVELPVFSSRRRSLYLKRVSNIFCEMHNTILLEELTLRINKMTLRRLNVHTAGT